MKKERKPFWYTNFLEIFCMPISTAVRATNNHLKGVVSKPNQRKPILFSSLLSRIFKRPQVWCRNCDRKPSTQRKQIACLHQRAAASKSRHFISNESQAVSYVMEHDHRVTVLRQPLRRSQRKRHFGVMTLSSWFLPTAARVRLFSTSESCKIFHSLPF